MTHGCYSRRWKRAMIDLNPNHLATVERILAEHVPECEVRAFGSRATWTAKDYSDLDLAIVGAGPLGWRTFGRLKEAFEESDLPMRVDVLDWYDIAESFRKVIERNYVVVQEAAKRPSCQWREVKLGDVAKIVMGQSPPGSTVSDKPGVALLNGPTEFGPHHPVPVQFTTDPRKFAQPGDVLFCVRGSTTGRMNWADQDYAIGRGVAAIRHAYDSTLQPLLRGVVELALPELLTAATGSTFPNVSAKQIAGIPFPDLNLEEQRAIAHVLGTLDDKIELNRRMNETLEEMARALFKSWFVDFEPVRAKMDGRWRRGESLPGLPAEHYDLFPDRLVPSEVGEIPEGWAVKPLGEVIELVYGKALRSAERKGGSIPVYGSNGQIDWHDKKLVSGPGIVVGRKGNPGVVSWAQGDFFPIDTTFYVVPKHANLGLHFLFFTLGDQDLPSVAADSAVPGLNRNLAYMNEQLLPNERVLAEFDKYARVYFTHRRSLGEESRALAAQRDALLPRLVSGTLLLADSEELVWTI